MSYFDNNATTPLLPTAMEAFQKALKEGWGNPSSPYRSSAKLRASMQKCREMIATSYDIDPVHVLFTSGATEANNSVFCVLARRAEISSRVLLSPFEHPSVTEAAHYWFPDCVDYLNARPDGTVSVDEITQYLENNQNYSLVSVMAASNESGVIQPWQQIAQLCKDFAVPYHCDSTQLPGKEQLNDLSLCSFNVASAHKFGGPKGIGWLIGENATSLLVGGEQENGRRGGTENYPAIVAASVAWESNVKRTIDISLLAGFRNHFEKQMENFFPGVKFLGKCSPRLWNTSLFIMPKFDNLEWVAKLDRLGYQVSTGSACSTTKVGGSPVATALELTPSETKRLVRISASAFHTSKEWDGLLSAFRQSGDELKKDFGDSSVISL